MQPPVTSFFHEATNTICHVAVEPNGRSCAIIDSVLDFDQASGRTSTEFADGIVDFIRERNLNVEWILETHAHADHLSAAPHIRSRVGGKIGIGEHITEVQELFKDIFNLERTFNTDGRQFDHLFKDGETVQVGRMDVKVMHTPGHTPACITYVMGDAAFVGDTLFMPDGGTARADFPGGDASVLYRSIHKVLALPPETRLFMCHDYGPGGREISWETTVAEQRERNIHVGGDLGEDDFVALRTARDKTLGMPTLLIPSVQINIRAGHMPPAEDNGTSYMKVPINRF